MSDSMNEANTLQRTKLSLFSCPDSRIKWCLTCGHAGRTISSFEDFSEHDHPARVFAILRICCWLPASFVILPGWGGSLRDHPCSLGQ
eukprot:6474509-Amphidinium_carterae.1